MSENGLPKQTNRVEIMSKNDMKGKFQANLGLKIEKMIRFHSLNFI